jgi:hypothetical protein
MVLSMHVRASRREFHKRWLALPRVTLDPQVVMSGARVVCVGYDQTTTDCAGNRSCTTLVHKFGLRMVALPSKIEWGTEIHVCGKCSLRCHEKTSEDVPRSCCLVWPNRRGFLHRYHKCVWRYVRAHWRGATSPPLLSIVILPCVCVAQLLTFLVAYSLPISGSRSGL